jgi:iron complex transport system ATP-binding protein
VHLHALESVIVAKRASGNSAGHNVEQEAYSILDKLGVAHLAMSFLTSFPAGRNS